MKKFFVTLLILAAAGLWFFRGRLFVSMPPITMNNSHVLVGNAPGDHALFALNAPCEIHAASLGYEFNSALLSFFPKVGARGMISFMDATHYKAIQNVSTSTGTCMAGFLNQCQRNGEIQHLILVPRDAAALDQMRHASIADGRSFYLNGRYLAFEEGTIDGKSFNGRMPGTGYFLVESIRRE